MQEEKIGQKHNENKVKGKRDKAGKGALLIPAGIFLGMGIGFIFNNLPAGIYVGLGAGFMGWVIILIFGK